MTDVTTQELVERLAALTSRLEPWSHTKAVAAMEDAASRLSEMEGEIKRLRAIMQNVAYSCPHQPLHPDEPEYDFGAHYFNTPDDYARYIADKNLSDIGDVLRAALGED